MSAQEGAVLPEGFIDRMGGYGSTALASHPDVAQKAEVERHKAYLVAEVHEAARAKVLKDRDLSDAGRARRLAEADAEALAALERQEAEVVDYTSRHEHNWATATHPQRVTKIPEAGPGHVSEPDVNYGRHVVLEVLRRKKIEGPLAVEAFLLGAARAGDRVTVGAAYHLPPAVRSELVPDELFTRLGEELHQALYPEEHERLRVLSSFWEYRKHIIGAYRKHILRAAQR